MNKLVIVEWQDEFRQDFAVAVAGVAGKICFR